MTEPAEFDPKTTPAIELDGKKWPIPRLAVRQLREVRRPLIDLTNRITAARVEAATLAGEDPADIADAMIRAGSDAFADLSKDDYASLLTEVVYQGLTRAHPKLAREEFIDMPISDDEMITAWFVVRDQSGVFVKLDKTEDQPPGEATGANQSPNQTGTE